MRLSAILLLFLAQQEVKLQPKSAVGEKATVSVESALDLEILVRDGEWDVGRQAADTGKGKSGADAGEKAVSDIKDEDWKSARLLSVVRREKFTQEVTQVTGGAPSGLTLQCLASTLQKSGTNLALGTSSTPLAGKSFAGTRSELGWVVKDAEGKPAPPEGQSLGAWNDCTRLLPRAAVKVNDVWKVDARDLADLLFSPGTSDVAGSLECALESLTSGRATVLIKGSAEGRGKDGSIVTLDVSGSRLVFDTRVGKPVSLSINGSIKSKREITEPYRKPGADKDEMRKIGEILAKSRKLEVSFVFE